MFPVFAVEMWPRKKGGLSPRRESRCRTAVVGAGEVHSRLCTLRPGFFVHRANEMWRVGCVCQEKLSGIRSSHLHCNHLICVIFEVFFISI